MAKIIIIRKKKKKEEDDDAVIFNRKIGKSTMSPLAMDKG